MRACMRAWSSVIVLSWCCIYDFVISSTLAKVVSDIQTVGAKYTNTADSADVIISFSAFRWPYCQPRTLRAENISSSVQSSRPLYMLLLSRNCTAKRWRKLRAKTAIKLRPQQLQIATRTCTNTSYQSTNSSSSPSGLISRTL